MTSFASAAGRRSQARAAASVSARLAGVLGQRQGERDQRVGDEGGGARFAPSPGAPSCGSEIAQGYDRIVPSAERGEQGGEETAVGLSGGDEGGGGGQAGSGVVGGADAGAGPGGRGQRLAVPGPPCRRQACSAASTAARGRAGRTRRRWEQGGGSRRRRRGDRGRARCRSGAWAAAQGGFERGQREHGGEGRIGSRLALKPSPSQTSW